MDDLSERLCSGFAEKRPPESLPCTSACSARSEHAPAYLNPLLNMNELDFVKLEHTGRTVHPVPMHASPAEALDFEECAVPPELVMDLVRDLEDGEKGHERPCLRDAAPAACSPALTIREERRRAKVARWKAKRLRQKARVFDADTMRKLQERNLEKERRSTVARKRYRKGGRFARKGPEFVSITEIQ